VGTICGDVFTGAVPRVGDGAAQVVLLNSLFLLVRVFLFLT
jgi:hypothetical protein